MKYLKLPKNRSQQQLIGVLAADMLVFGTINADHATAWQLFLGFMLTLATIYCSLQVLTSLLMQSAWPRLHKRLALYSTLIAGGILALQSVGELGGIDVIVMVPLIAIGYFYVSYNKAAAKQRV